MENAEINNIIKIVGLQYKKSYDDPESLRSLRYGKIMIMTDQVAEAMEAVRTAAFCPLPFEHMLELKLWRFWSALGSRWVPYQRAPHQLLSSQLAVLVEAHVPGGIYHTHCQSKAQRRTVHCCLNGSVGTEMAIALQTFLMYTWKIEILRTLGTTYCRQCAPHPYPCSTGMYMISGDF